MEDLNNNDPSNWRLGLFYYNKSDKRMFVPKRVQGLGWTLNFANPYTSLFLVGLIVFLWVVLLYEKGI
jgi:uncharacterized membrane protein